MKKRHLRGLAVALALAGLASAATLSAPQAGAAVTPASASSHSHAVQPLGGCIMGFICGSVVNNSSSFIWVSDNWCGTGCGNVVSIAPGQSSPFADTDALAPDQGCTV